MAPELMFVLMAHGANNLKHFGYKAVALRGGFFVDFFFFSW
jgi:hypothetical protein